MGSYRDATNEVLGQDALRTGKTPLESIEALLARSGIDPEEIGRVSSIRLSEWQQGYKDNEGEAHVLDLKGASLILHPSWEEGPQYPLVQPAHPVKISFGGRVDKVPPPKDGLERAVVLPDPQFGFMRNMAGELIPFHDPGAVYGSLTLLRAIKPSVVVILGDVLDLPVLSKYRTHPSFEGLMQPTIQAAHEWLAGIRSAVGESCVIWFLEGNHDKRLTDYVIDHAKALFGLRRAGDPPDSWPLLTVPSLLNLESLGINYVPGYPVCKVKLAPNLVAIHGKKLKLEQVIHDERVCVVQGHTHKAKLTYFQHRQEVSQNRWVASPGCLCKVDGTVPGVNQGIDPRGHEPIDNPQDWHQGLAVLTYDVLGLSSPRYEFVPFDLGSFVYRDRHYTGVSYVE